MHSRGDVNDRSDETFGAGRTLGVFQSQWSEDSGEATTSLRETLKIGDPESVVAELLNSRVFIALAPSGKDGSLTDGPLTDGSDARSEMSVVCITAADGRLGLLVFSGIDALANWNQQARPVPITAADAAKAALEEGAVALVIDPAGPHPFTVTLPDVVALAPGDHRSIAIGKIEEMAYEIGLQTCIVGKTGVGPITVSISVSESTLFIESLEHRSDIHAFAPEGIEITASDSLLSGQ